MSTTAESLRRLIEADGGKAKLFEHCRWQQHLSGAVQTSGSGKPLSTLEWNFGLELRGAVRPPHWAMVRSEDGGQKWWWFVVDKDGRLTMQDSTNEFGKAVEAAEAALKEAWGI
jgi:hypothetical protein